MSWKLDYGLDATEYSILQDGYMTAEVTETSNEKILVCEVGLDFDWMPKDIWWYTDCNLEVEPGQRVPLPRVWFEISLDAKEGTRLCRPGITYKVLQPSGWGPMVTENVPSGKHVMIKKAKSLNVEVFISHSNAKEDQLLLRQCKQYLTKCGLKPYVAELSPKPGYLLWRKIGEAIRNADVVMVLWTKQGAESGDIREEIGMAVDSHKAGRIVPLVETGVEVKGSLNSLEYIPFKRGSFKEALAIGLTKILDSTRSKKQGVRRRTTSTTL